MTIDPAIVFGIISIVGSLLIAAVGYGAMKQKVDSMNESNCVFRAEHAQQHSKEEEATREKFKELYESRNITALAVERLTTLIEQVFKRLDSIEGKLDKAIDRNN